MILIFPRVLACLKIKLTLNCKRIYLPMSSKVDYLLLPLGQNKFSFYVKKEISAEDKLLNPEKNILKNTDEGNFL